jgi:hypothetical protein
MRLSSHDESGSRRFRVDLTGNEGPFRSFFTAKDCKQRENDMYGKAPSSKELRAKGGMIDERQQGIDPAKRPRVDPTNKAKRSQKQPGQDLTDPQKKSDDGK